MRIREKLYMELSGIDEHGPITIVALGDSVTHGSVAAGEIDYETVYWNRLRRKLNAVRATIPVNVINAGINGTTAARSVARLDRQVLCHNPDLVIVCFGLNDVNGELEKYLDSLRIIFARCRESGAEVIFMTPNMLNTRVDERTEACFAAYAVKTAEMQNWRVSWALPCAIATPSGRRSAIRRIRPICWPITSITPPVRCMSFSHKACLRSLWGNRK